MKKVNIVTVGSALKDIMFYSDEIFVQKNKNKKDLTRQKFLAIEYGAKIEIDEVFVNYGGGALNVAVGLKNFGLKVAPLINVGRDWVGQEIYYFLKSQKINISLIKIDKKHRTGFSVILTAAKDKEHTIFTSKGATKFLTIPKNLHNVKTEWFYLGPLSMQNWHRDVVNVINYAKLTRKQMKIAWNPGRKQLADFIQLVKLFPYIDILFLNKDEAIEFVLNVHGKKIKKKRIGDNKYLLDVIKEFGMSNLVITDGKKGVYGSDEKNKYYFQKAQDNKKMVDTVGAGDAFASGFLAAFYVYQDFKKSLNLGIKNSAATLTRIGAQNGLLKLKLK